MIKKVMPVFNVFYKWARSTESNKNEKMDSILDDRNRQQQYSCCNIFTPDKTAFHCAFLDRNLEGYHAWAARINFRNLD